MGKGEKILERLLTGPVPHNVSFQDLLTAVRSLGLNERSGKKHQHIFQGNPGIFLMFQPKHGKAKPYQIGLLRDAVVRIRGASIEAEQ